MSDESILFGGATLNLKKSSDEFVVLWPTAENLNILSNGDEVTAINRIAPGAWAAKARDPEKLDAAMHRSRQFTVAHHRYYVDDDLQDPFVITDAVNIKFRETYLSDDAWLIRQFGLVKTRSLSSRQFTYRVTSRTGMNPLKLCATLAGDARLEYVEPDYIIPIERFCTDSLLPKQWHLKAIDGDDRILPTANIRASEAWGFGKGTEEIVIAVIDDGFDLTLEDLSFGIVSPADFSVVAGSDDVGQQIVPTDNEPFGESDRNDFHGTPCAGLAIGRNRRRISGVAPGCSWMPVRINFGMSQNTLLEVFRFVSQRADVVSCSWGMKPSGYVSLSSTACDVFAEITASGGRRGSGLVVCFSAGNYNLPTYIRGEDNPEGMEYYGTNGTVLGHFFHSREIHGGWTEIPNIVAVAATTSRNRKSLYSNWGPQITVAAPSDNWHPRSPQTREQYRSPGLVTTDNVNHGLGLADVGLAPEELGEVTTKMGGTSGATPLVAGVCGLVLSANPSLSAGDVLEILRQTSSQDRLDFDLDEPDIYNNRGRTGQFDPVTKHSQWFGYGLIDACAAVEKARESV